MRIFVSCFVLAATFVYAATLFLEPNGIKILKREVMISVEDKRKGEIALVLLREKTKKEGVRLFPEAFERDLGNISSATGISKDELKKFYKEEYQLLLDETFSEK